MLPDVTAMNNGHIVLQGMHMKYVLLFCLQVAFRISIVLQATENNYPLSPFPIERHNRTAIFTEVEVASFHGEIEQGRPEEAARGFKKWFI